MHPFPGIHLCARQGASVRPLRPPLQRATLWILLAAAILLLFTALHGVRPDLAERLRQPAFALGTGGAMLSGILAAVAAFQLGLPDRSAKWR